MYRTQCGLCAGHLNLFLDLGKTPLADRFPTTRDESEEVFNLRVGMCERCKLVQLLDIVDDNVLYGADYAYYTGAASSHLPYWDSYVQDLARRIPSQNPATTGRSTTLLEIACNDGSLLTRLAEEGYDVVGIDPATGPLNRIPSRIRTYPIPFDLATAAEMQRGHREFDIVVANNVLAHVSDMVSFIRAVDKVTHRDSVVVLEVQYLGDLVTGNQFDHFYHEHRSFFSLRTLNRLLVARGFSIFDVLHTEAQGGSIRVFASKGSLKYPIAEVVPAVLAREAWLDEWFTMESMAGRVEHIRDLLNDELGKLAKFPALVAGYGATAKSCTLLNYCGITDLEWVVDTTPWKQGRFTPGTKIPVIAPQDEPANPDTYLMLAWNYLPAILRREQAFTRKGGKFLVPLPKPVLL